MTNVHRRVAEDDIQISSWSALGSADCGNPDGRPDLIRIYLVGDEICAIDEILSSEVALKESPP